MRLTSPGRRTRIALLFVVLAAGAVPVPPGIAREPTGPARSPGTSGVGAPAQAPPLGPVRFVPTGPGARVTVHAVFPKDPSVCQPNQATDLTAAYPGTLEVGRRANGDLYLITELTFSDYLKGIAEVPTSWPLAALEAQVVAARTYAISRLNSGGVAGLTYDICSTDACQVYRGLAVQDGPYGQEWSKAVDNTAGQILQYQGRPADALYYSTSNGHTYSNADIFGGTPLPYLQPVPETDDTQSTESNWSVPMPLSDLAQILTLGGSWDGGTIDRVLQQGGNVVISRADKTITLSLSTFRNKLNINAVCLQPRRYPSPSSGGGKLPQVVPSLWLQIAQQGATMVITGRGWGHGVGMVQWGAKGKADRGLSYSDILAYYYGGLRPVKVAEPGSVRVLLATDAQQVTVVPSGPVRLDGAPLGAGPLSISGGAAMTVSRGGSIAPTLTLSDITATASAASGAPAQFSFTLNHPANVGLSYQQPGGPATATVAPAPFGTGAQTLRWDPLGAGLPTGPYAVAVVADDGVSRVVSSSFSISVGTPSPSASPSAPTVPPDAQSAGQVGQGGGGSSGKVPAWLAVAATAAVVLVLAVGFFLVASTRRRQS